MIELPSFFTISAASPTFVDMGFTQRGLSSLSRIDRKGSRYKMACSCGPFVPEQARVLVADLIAAKSEGLRIALPLLHDQGSPGSPLVSTAVSTGKTLVIKGLTPGYTCKKGYFLSIVKSGQHYLHNVKTGGMANGSGVLTVTLNEMVRTSFSVNDVIHLARPMIEGFVEGDEWQWSYDVNRMVPINFTIEEAA